MVDEQCIFLRHKNYNVNYNIHQSLTLCIQGDLWNKYGRKISLTFFCNQKKLGLERPKIASGDDLFWIVKVKVSPVQLFVTPWTIQSMEFSREGYWSR